MKVKIIATGAVMDANASFANRLVEQGKAVVIHEVIEPKKPAKKEKPADKDDDA